MMMFYVTRVHVFIKMHGIVSLAAIARNMIFYYV